MTQCLENQTRLEIRLAQLVALASTSAHPRVDLDKSDAPMQQAFHHALGAIPHLNGGRSAEDAAQDDIKNLYAAYQAYLSSFEARGTVEASAEAPVLRPINLSTAEEPHGKR